jgi:DNA-binding winged helix-turn-helix (wHTH) protein
MTTQNNHSYKFGPFRLEGQERRLLHNGKVVPLPPKAFDTLLVLIQNSGRLVDREMLIRAIWGDAFVEENNLSVNISLIRKALAQSGTEFEYIETVPKHGYRFVAKVQGVIDDPSTSPEQELGQDQIAASPFCTFPINIKQMTVTFRGYHWHVLVGCCIYACHYMITILLEVAYRFDVYGTRAMIAAPIFFCWIFITSVWGLAVALKVSSKSKGYGIVLGASIFIAAAMVAFSGAWFVLPHAPVTEANFQTFAAPAAYLKDIAYILPIALLYLIVPFHFVSALEQEIEQRGTKGVLKLLSGSKLSLRPAGTIYIKIWVLGLLLAGWLAYSLAGRAHLFDNLLPSPYLVMFEVLHQTRTMLQFALGFYCMAWYYWALNRLKSKCLPRIV